MSTPVERPRGTVDGGDPSQYVRERSVDGRRDVSYPPAPEPLGIPVYDNHAHLEIEDGPSTGSGTIHGLSLDEQLERALAVGVHGVVQAGGDIGVPPVDSPMDFSAWFQVYLDGAWHTFDARHNTPRIGRILMATGRDATDVALSTAFGRADLVGFSVVTDEVPGGQVSGQAPGGGGW